MKFEWFNAREASKIGAALADEFAPPGHGSAARGHKAELALQAFLQRADNKVRRLRLNFYKRAKFASSFKWKLIENGVERNVADDVTQSLVMHLSLTQSESPPRIDIVAPVRDPAGKKKLLAQGNKQFGNGDYAGALTLFEELLELDPDNADALNNVGSALWNLGRYVEAEQYYRRAISVRPDYAEAHCNLGNVLRWRGCFAESEASLRRAIKLRPTYIEAHCNLGLTFVFLGRLRDAMARFKKVLKAKPRHVDALFGTAQIAALEGRFEEAERLCKRVLEIQPEKAAPWTALANLRRMTASDAAWIEHASAIAAGGLVPLEEAGLRFAIGKYCDDVGDFERAFRSYERANQLLKPIAEPYSRDARAQFVETLIRVYSREAISRVGQGGSPSRTPVFVVGMMRSGTSLTDQIISSHPSASGAGELAFWSDIAGEHDSALRQGLLSESLRKSLAETYLGVLKTNSRDAYPAPRDIADPLRIVDKAPINSDYLGIIHSALPNARIIYMQRNPIDVCLSCFFQQLPLTLNFTLDLSDLAHYYRQHQRLMAHWRAVLPPGTILDVPYADLVDDQEGWTRRILDFLGLDWDERCLDFHQTKRAVVTASYWQVRQKVYKRSVERWRNYEKFIGPLRDLKIA